jgi:hypothetical protein
MTKRRLILILAVVAMAMSVMAPASAGGNTAEKKADAGFLCFEAGPSDWTHCLREAKIGNPAIPVNVYSQDGMTFLGTELLLRSDVYNDQGCPQDGLVVWVEPAGPGDLYAACHHFHTGHH